MTIWNYLFTTPPTEFRYFWPLLIICLSIIGSSHFFRRKLNQEEKHLKTLLKNYPTRIIATASIIILFLFARALHMRILSARVILFILLAFLAYLVINPIYLYYYEYPTLKRNIKNKEREKKYLPGKKR